MRTFDWMPRAAHQLEQRLEQRLENWLVACREDGSGAGESWVDRRWIDANSDLGPPWRLRYTPAMLGFPRLRSHKISTIMIVSAMSLLLLSCSSGAPLSDTSVEPDSISPNHDGDSDVARLSYSVGVPAVLSITMTDADGVEHVLRDSLPRAPGRYEALFGGVIDGRMLADGHYVVRFVAEPGDGAEEVVAAHSLTIQGADTEPPVLAGLAVRPDTFTPNQDGIGDRVSISYRLDEPAEVRVWLESEDGTYVTDILEDLESAEHPGEPGAHVYDYDAGVDADAPPPADGQYTVVAEARDGVGNVSRQEVPLAIEDGGQPRASLIGDVEWSDTVVPLGSTLWFTVTVRNDGGTPIRTRGPEPGTVYGNTESFNQIAPAEVLLLARAGDKANAVRVSTTDGDQDVTIELTGDGVQDGNPVAESDAGETGSTTSPLQVCGTVQQRGNAVGGAEVYAFEADGDNGVLAVADRAGRFCFPDVEVPPAHELTYARSPGSIRLGLEYDEMGGSIAYPFRWQLGASDALDVCEVDERYYLCLPPGETATVHGGLRFDEPPFRRGTNVYLALMHEDVRRMHGPYDPQRVTVEY